MLGWLFAGKEKWLTDDICIYKTELKAIGICVGFNSYQLDICILMFGLFIDFYGIHAYLKRRRLKRVK